MFHYHIHKMRCRKCTIEWAVHIACEYPPELIICPECGELAMTVMERNQIEQFPLSLLMAGQIFHLVKMPNQVSLKTLKEKLGITE